MFVCLYAPAFFYIDLQNIHVWKEMLKTFV